MSDLNSFLRGKRVRIADDDPVIRSVACAALEAIGLEVDESPDGEHALRALELQPPDLLVLDVEMPGADGITCCRRLRQTAWGAEIPVMVLTGHSDGETIESAFEAGATDFVTKPLDPQLLQHRVRFVLQSSDAASGLRRTLDELRHSQHRLATAQHMASLGNWEWTPDSGEMLWSEEMYRILGAVAAPGAATYEALMAAVHPEDRAELENAMQRAALEGKSWSLDHRIVARDGEERFVHHQAIVRADALGEAERVAGIIQDLTERRRAEEEIRYLSYYDAITGLPNRRMFEETLRHGLVQARRHERILGLLFIDLDRFKRVNETLGRMAGDELLQGVAGRLQESVRTTDHVGTRRQERPDNLSRMGSDEFTVVLTELRSPDDASLVAHRVQEALKVAFHIGGQEIFMSASVGIALFPSDGPDAETMLARANTAMHHAKSEGPGLYRFFNASMNVRAMRNLQLEAGLRKALERDEIVLHYQPLHSVATGQVTELEALARWNSEELGAVTPAEFIPIAEETGLIEPLGEWILRTACAQLQQWRRAGLPPVRVAVNVSSLQFREQGMAEMVRRALRDFELDPADLRLELTESALFGDDPNVIQAMRALKELGVGLALDDFGTGYSSLSYLVRFPIDTIKIDRSFVTNVGADPQADAMIAAVVGMARRLGLTVTAEGVETAEQKAFLGAEGCDTLQGYLLGRPVDAAAITEILRAAAQTPGS